MERKFKILLTLAASVLGIGALTGCTKDDIADLQSQVTSLQEELNDLKAQIKALQEQMASDIQAAKDDYNAKIDAAKAQIADNQEKIEKLNQALEEAKSTLSENLEKEISTLKEYVDGEVDALETKISKLNADLTSLKEKHDSDLEAAKADYNAKIEALTASVSSDMEKQKEEIQADYTNKIKELNDAYNADKEAIEADIASLESSISEFKEQYATDKKSLEDDYTAKIKALEEDHASKISSLKSDIDSLESSISSLKDELAAEIEKIQSDYNGKIEDLTDRMTSLEDEDRSTLLRGHGEPSSSLGKDGDSYVDLDSWDFYTKDGGTWTKSGNFKGNDAITYIPCIFQNYDGTKLFEFYYEKGSDIVYEGPTPTKPDETIDGYDVKWQFAGWDKPLENIQKPTIFTALFESPVKCTFKNYDGTVLYETSVSFGESVEYAGETPTKPDTVSGDQTLVWIFDGWDKSLDSIKEDTVFTARFYAPNAIKCTFLNYDGTELYVTYCGNGDRVEYAGDTPKKEDDDDGEGTITRYTFSDWGKSLKNITEDTTFTAQFSSTAYYLCKFVNYDDSPLYETLVVKGGIAEYAGSTPVREQEADGTTITDYSFSSWDKDASNVTAPTTFKAQYYVRTFTGHKVTFKNGGETLYSHYFEDGTNASYPYELPYSFDSETVTQFFRWDKSIKNISEDVETNAVVRTLSRKQNGEYPQTRVEDSALAKEIRSDGIVDKQGYYSYGGERYEYYVNYFFKVEPIRWKFLENPVEGTSTLTSWYILDAHRYNEWYDGGKDGGYYANNYKNSEIRSWLNADFLEKAFYYDDSLVTPTEVDNGAATTNSSTNKYACENTTDNVFLLSYRDLYNADYGFASDEDRKCKVTDYAASRGVSYSSGTMCGYYWTRSPFSSGSYRAWYVDGGGLLFNYNDVFYSNYGVRPSLSLKVS